MGRLLCHSVTHTVILIYAQYMFCHFDYFVWLTESICDTQTLKATVVKYFTGIWPSFISTMSYPHILDVYQGPLRGNKQLYEIINV